MQLNFTTLFNINYTAKGLALHASLLKTCSNFHLYIFAFDDLSYKILTEKKLEHSTIIALHNFESEALLAVKQGRSVAEYCWTCTPHTIKYCIEKFNLDHCTYLDADIYFYQNPGLLIDEMGDNSVLITPHNYHHKYDASAISGIYCVQFTTFKNNQQGLTVLNWWAQACLNWCYARYEDGKMGDQKYLDCWPYIFDGVYICHNTAAGLAPWNVLNYNIITQNQTITVTEKPLIFYHFHDLRYLSNNTWFIGGYDMPDNVIEHVYKPYIRTLLAIYESLKDKYNGVDTLYKLDVKSLNNLSFKFKLGIYIIDIKRSFGQFISDLFFIGRNKHYKKNYIKL